MQGVGDTCWRLYHESKSGLAPESVTFYDERYVVQGAEHVASNRYNLLTASLYYYLLATSLYYNLLTASLYYYSMLRKEIFASPRDG